jgi:predicted Zn-dependent protease
VAGTFEREVEIAGRKFLLSQPKLIGIYSEIEKFILRRKELPEVWAMRACRNAPPTMHQAIWDAAAKMATTAKFVSREEWKAYEDSKWPAAFLLYGALDPKHREDVPTVEAAMDLIMEEAQNRLSKLDEVIASAKRVQQEDDLGNSSGRTRKRPA